MCDKNKELLISNLCLKFENYLILNFDANSLIIKIQNVLNFEIDKKKIKHNLIIVNKVCILI